MWAHPRTLISWPSDQWSGLYCCFHLIQVFSPGEGLLVCVSQSAVSRFTWGMSPTSTSHTGLVLQKRKPAKIWRKRLHFREFLHLYIEITFDKIAVYFFLE